METVVDPDLVWQAGLAVIGFIVWLVRLEGKVAAARERIKELEDEVKANATKTVAELACVREELARVRESLARIEGALEVK